MIGRAILSGMLVCAAAARGGAAELPGQYFRLMESGIAQVEQRLAAQPSLDLKAFETDDNGYPLFPHVVLVAAVLYVKQDSSNHRWRDPKMLSLAMKIGDSLAGERQKGKFSGTDNERDLYMWLEAYRLLERDLGEERRECWRQELQSIVQELAGEVARREDFPGYQSPFIGTSPNHLALWTSTVYLAGRVFGNRKWEELGTRVLHRFAVEEQSPNGYWGEHERSLPTPGYGYNTYASVSLYYEFSHDPAALKALRRGLLFHKFFTYPDGSPLEVLDDRNRYTSVVGWGSTGLPRRSGDMPPGGNDESASKGQFGFSNFRDGRRYAEFLTSFFHEGRMAYEDLGRIAQDALYYHPGPKAPIPQDLPRYTRQLTVPAGIRKTGHWVVCLSGLISTQAVTSQFYLDRQGHLSIFHDKLGLIVTGAGSKRQSELATFSEKLQGQTFHMPISSRLQMSTEKDRLSLAYNTFFSDLYVPPPSDDQVTLRFVITGRGPPADEAQLTLQLCLKPGEILETAAGRRILLGTERVELKADALGGWIRHHGWTLKIDPAARLVWPVYPHDPYTDAPETALEHAVGVLSVPLRLGKESTRGLRPGEQEISFTLTAQ